MKSEFLQPRFEGARFNEHTLPLEVARDLAAYEILVVELAKHLYLHAHPDRQRVPKGFASDFHLHLERVDEGSSRPVLSIVTASALVLAAGNVYFEQARDLITECIAAPEGQLPPAFPRELLAHFNQIGRSLRADERMEISADGKLAVLDQDRRKRLVLAAETVYEREVDLSGTIEEVDWDKSTFRLRLSDGTKMIIPMPETFHHQAGSYGGRRRHQATVHGVGAYDSWDRLQKIISVESLEMQQDYLMAMKFDEIRAIENGWHNGQGTAFNLSQLGKVASKLIGHFPEKLPIPAIVPTPEGNLLFEWNVSGQPSVDLRLADLKAEFHAFHPHHGDIEREFNLASDAEWPVFFAFLLQNIGEHSA
jgi:hypothetical protein